MTNGGSLSPSPSRSWDDYDVYLFDVDGTLLECAGAAHYFAFCEALQVLSGRPLTLEGVVAHGNTDIGILRDALTLAQVAEEAWRPRLASTCAAMCSYVQEHHSELHAAALPQAKEILHYLREKGALLGLATGNLAGIGKLKLQQCGFISSFDFAQYSDGYEYRGDVVRAALDRARSIAGERATVCMVGDTPADVEAAHANGIDVIAVATGIYSVERLVLQKPRWCLHSFQELSIPPAPGNEGRL